MKLSPKLPLIYDLTRSELEAQLKEWGQPSFRAKQIWQGLYVDLWQQPDEFSTLPKGLRAQLLEYYSFGDLKLEVAVDSSDGQTIKSLFRLPDGEAIEAVLMREDERRTLCISTQAGCKMGCVFCATGQMGFRSNLTSGQIVEQVLHYARLLKAENDRPTNVVIMGMGEPFDNYDATMAAIDQLNDSDGFNFGARRFTVSTVGLIPAIQKFTAEKRQVNLAISLHSTEDGHRSDMLPINRRYPIADLIAACREYVEMTGRRITFEWALIHGENDSVEEANRLADLLGDMNCHVNAIPLNPTSGYEGVPTDRNRSYAFRDTLEARGIPCTIRVRRGIDINAGCGQLAIVN
jgi:23S rRNA (adenine2503-C2)-methyltransferase